MAGTTTKELEVRFEVLDYSDSRALALVFMRVGQPLPPNGRVFTLELTPDTTKLEADTLVSLLNRRVVALVETRAPPPSETNADA